LSSLVTETNALAVHGLRKSYDDVVAVDGLDLEVRTGECFGLLGPNGAGKTTTIEICEGLLSRDSGEVVVLGQTWETTLTICAAAWHSASGHAARRESSRFGDARPLPKLLPQVTRLRMK
jgi:ABC-type branched-subunit amino acid transport system ATPase component